jgi:hypothetical protein
MKQHNGLWITLGIVFGCTLLFVSIIEAQPEHVRSPLPFSMQPPYGFKPRIEPPGHFFVEKPDRGIVWGKLAISEDQKAQMREQFREFLINSAGNWYKEQVIRQDGLSEMHKAPDRILTPEQLEKLFQHKVTMLILFKLKAEFEKLLLSPEIPEIKNLPSRQPAIIETDVTFEHERPAMIAQKSKTLPTKPCLHILQILRV